MLSYALLQAFKVLLEDLEMGFAKCEEDLIDFTSSQLWVRIREPVKRNRSLSKSC